MAREVTVTVTDSDWTELTNADVTEISFQNIGPGTLLIKGTADATPPTSTAGAYHYGAGDGELGLSLATAFSAVAASRVFGRAANGTRSITVVVNHA